ncbi:MAG: GAF domain-containing protein [Anaerolineales bacterium]|nr:GAF domain-containing protein [Anaerolineales bacterium]
MGDRTVSGKAYIETLFKFSKLISHAEDVSIVFPDLVEQARKLIIFDNFVIYLEEKGELRPAFARSVGRGRSKEADIAWGESFIEKVFESNKLTTHQDVVQGPNDDRLKIPYYIGSPLRHGKTTVGVLIMIRFGGPEFNSQDQQTFTFIADHIAQLLERDVLVSTIAQIEGSQRMWAMQENFVATVSHDLRTPLGFIKGYTTTLLREDTNWDVPTYREFLGIIDEEADRLQELIDNLLDSSRLQSGTLQMNLQVVRLDAVLRDMIQRSQLREIDVNLELEIESQGVIVQADPMRLGQVFDNLINNAIKYAPRSTVIIRLFVDGDDAVIKVIDDGPGIDKEHLERIFQRFYRVPETRMAVRGSGLGLYICRQIIIAHDGTIKAESDTGQGTTFYITLPIVEGDESV